MDTYFATATKTAPDALVAEIEIVNQSPVLDGLLHNLGGLLAVLDANRQILAVNDALLSFMGVDDPGKTLGLRPGQALACVHAEGEPAGCGTTQACASCGAVIAIVASLETDRPVERLCALKATREGRTEELALMVRSQPIRIDGHRFLLLFIQDVSDDQRRAALERTFFHDINNLLAMLLGASEILLGEYPGELSRTLYQVAKLLRNEVHLQAFLVAREPDRYTPAWEPLSVEGVLADMERLFAAHPAAQERQLLVPVLAEAPLFQSDHAALIRVLSNMVLNAFEATEPGGAVSLGVEVSDRSICFSVWNQKPIPAAVQTRIFQRNFSTKAESGRGMGTYSMKLFGEKLLRGRVDFTSNEDQGTTFRLTLPLVVAASSSEASSSEASSSDVPATNTP
jgi:signal transduction histidine kinase